MPDRSILLLGGSPQQVVAIKAAKRLGLRTVLCDYLPDNPGQKYADVYYLESTTERRAILKIAIEERVHGVLAYSSDPAASTAAYVAEELGLPTNPLRSVETLSSKDAFREHLLKNELPCPKFFYFDMNLPLSDVKSHIEEIGLPVVVKPTDASGSKGVSVIRNVAELEQAIVHAHKYSKNGKLIIEQYIERAFPCVIGGDVFILDGIIQFWGLMSCLRDTHGNVLVPVGKKIPSGLSDEQTVVVKAMLQNLVDSLGLIFGEMNVEVILGSNDTPYVLELGARAGGNMIPVQLSDVSGIDLVSANISSAMGDGVESLDFDGNPTNPSAHYVLHSNQSGIFSGVSYSKAILPHIYRKVIYLSPGDCVEKFEGANNAVGIVFLRFSDTDEMSCFLNDISDHIHIDLVED